MPRNSPTTFRLVMRFLTFWNSAEIKLNVDWSSTRKMKTTYSLNASHCWPRRLSLPSYFNRMAWKSKRFRKSVWFLHKSEICGRQSLVAFFFRKQKKLPKINRINLISTYRDAALDIEFFYSLAVTRVGILNCGFYFLESSKRVEKLFFKISTPSRPWSRAQTFEHFFWLFHFCRRVLFLVFIAKRFCMFIFVSRKVLNFQKPWTTNLDQQNKRVDFQFRKRHFLMTPHGPERGLSSELFLRVFVSALKFLTFSIWYFRKKDLKVM